MTKYQKLFETHKNTLNENEELKKRNELLVSERRALAKELEKKENFDKETGAVFTALRENLVKSLKAKNIINMKPEEKDAMYCMMERFLNLAMLLKP